MMNNLIRGKNFVLTFIIVLFILQLLLDTGEARRRRGTKKKTIKSMVLRKKETNAVDFIRLSVMRLIYGLATRFGFEEQISEVLNGAFVPPGVEDDYDYGGGGFGDGGGILGGGFSASSDYDY